MWCECNSTSKASSAEVSNPKSLSASSYCKRLASPSCTGITNVLNIKLLQRNGGSTGITNVLDIELLQRNGGTVEQWNSGTENTEEQRNRGTEEQWNSGTVEQWNRGYRGTEEQRNNGTEE